MNYKQIQQIQSYIRTLVALTEIIKNKDLPQERRDEAEQLFIKTKKEVDANSIMWLGQLCGLVGRLYDELGMAANVENPHKFDLMDLATAAYLRSDGRDREADRLLKDIQEDWDDDIHNRSDES